jgi:alpha-galactosidase
MTAKACSSGPMRRSRGLHATLHALLIVIVLLCKVGSNAAVADPPNPIVSAGDKAMALEWFDWATSFGHRLPFSFEYGGEPSSGFLPHWMFSQSSASVDQNRTRYDFVWTDPATRLVVDCRAVRYADFPTAEWTVYFKNNGDADSPVISNIEALDLRFARASGSEFDLHYSRGSMAKADDYEPLEQALPPGSNLPIGVDGGRSTEQYLPFFNLVGSDRNLIVGLGWPGNWKARFARDHGSGIAITAGQGVTHFFLQSGEEARSPLVVIQWYTGDWIRGQNIWRRWMIAHNMPLPGGALPQPIMAAGAPEIYNLNYHAAAEIAAMDGEATRRGMPYNHWWIDAGWYPDDGSWPNIGDWYEDLAKFPGGFLQVSDHARSLGLKQILWFEPERVTAGSDLDRNYHDWLITLPGSPQRLFNLANPIAADFLTNYISDRIGFMGVDVYRQDFNIDPLPYWRSLDSPNRQGITENHYITGLLSFWDGLLARHPNLLIDCCASGGRRNDLEILRRAVPLLQSDYRFEPIGTQDMNYAYPLWVVYHGDGGPSDHSRANLVYNWRTHMAPCHAIGLDPNDDQIDWNEAKLLMTQEQSVEQYYYGDYYPLTPYSLDNDAWIAWQYDRPDLGAGMIQAFRRPDNKDATHTFRLRGLDPAANYSVMNEDTQSTVMYSGQALMDTGVEIPLPDSPSAALYVYRLEK